jgi:hypothetical protein
MGQARATGMVAMAGKQTGRDHRARCTGAPCGAPVSLAASRQSVAPPGPQPKDLICRNAARSSK